MKKYLLVLIAFLFAAISPSPAQEIKVMTYNLLNDNNPSDDENAWSQRRETLVNQIRFYAPDVFGTQEGLEHQLQYMDESLKDYKYVGVGRADVMEKGLGEFSAVFYNTKKYKKLSDGTFWLSETPYKPSRGWDASLNRICTYILLQDKADGTKFYLFNTHFDHKGKEARKNSAELIIKKIKEINKSNLPFFLIGDFNLTPEEAPIQFISKELNDSKSISKQPPFGPDGTFNGFKVCQAPKHRIDYIFVSKNNINVNKYAVLANVKDVKYPSDHFPVLIEAEIKP